MLSFEHKIKFCQATAYWNRRSLTEFEIDPADSIAAICDSPDDVASTAETVDDFIKVWGEPHERLQTPVGDLLIWKGIQTAKGRRRGDSFVMDFGSARASYFTGG